MDRVIVVGAGISGLTCAYYLKRAGKQVTGLEQSGEAGGKILTERIEGYLLEFGPNTFRIENEQTLVLLRALDIESKLIEASPNAKKRFILKNGAWVNAPSSPPEAIASPLLSVAGKLRILGELFCTRSR